MPENQVRAARLSVMAQVGLLAGPFMSMIDSSIVNVALPDIARSLHSTLAAAQWVVSAYLLALGMALPGTAYLAKRFGTRPVYLASLVGFTIASALCAASPSVATLSTVRVLQGIFGAAMVPLAMNMLFGEGQSSHQMSPVAGMMLFLAPAVAPALGGLLLPWAGWPAIFLVNVPVGFLALLGVRQIPPSVDPGALAERPPFDLPGFLLLAGGIAATTYGASEAVQTGWLSLTAWPYWAAGVPLLAAYIGWAARRRHAIVDLQILRPPQQAFAMALNAVVSIVTFALIVVVPAFVQEFQGQSAIVAGMVLLPQGLTTGIGAVLGNALPRRFGVRRTAFLGMAILSLATFGMLVVSTETPPWLTAVILCGRGFAIGLVIQPVLNRLIGSLPAAQVPDGNTVFNIVDRISGAVGIALIVTFFQLRERVMITSALAHFRHLHKAPSSVDMTTLPPAARAVLSRAATAGLHDVVWLIAALSVVGLLMTLGISREPLQGGAS